MTLGDAVWIFLVGLPVWALISWAVYTAIRPRPTRLSIVPPDAYGRASDHASQMDIEDACDVSLRRSQERREYSRLGANGNRLYRTDEHGHRI
jgi:hypothetical protein